MKDEVLSILYTPKTNGIQIMFKSCGYVEMLVKILFQQLSNSPTEHMTAKETT